MDLQLIAKKLGGASKTQKSKKREFGRAQH